MRARSASTVTAGLIVAGLLPLLGGCTLGPDYKREGMAGLESWRDAPPAADTASLANVEWWNLFRDPKLQDLIRAALANNQDLKVAVERIVEAQARVGYVRADLFPKVDVGLDGGYQEASREGFPKNPPPGDNNSPMYGMSLDLTWEVDVFGRIRRSTESERAQLLATEEGRRAVAISLVAAVANTYVELRSADQRLEIATRTLETRAKSRDLARIRFEGGLTSEKDPRQAEAEYRRVEVTVLQLEQLDRQTENALSVLVGGPPGPIARGTRLPDLPVGMAVPAGLPSELLDRRPDLGVAEQQLHSATANVGAAKALLFPRIALTASYGTQSSELDALFTGSSQAWSLASGLVQPIFNAGKNLRRVTIAESQMRQALYVYEKAVLVALREVEDGLVAFRKTGEERGAQALRVAAERKVVDLSMARYEGGVADYLEVLDAQRSLFTAELDEVQTMSEQVASLVRLYKALGGGWSATPDPAAPAAVDETAKTAASAPIPDEFPK